VMLEDSHKRKSSSIVPARQPTKNRLFNQGTMEASHETQLTMAIADFVHSKGLSFSATEGCHFKRVLKLSKQVSTYYIPPGRRAIGTELLDLN
jgi:hypothetical protein